MALRDHSGVIALSTSLVLHGALSCYAVQRTASDLAQRRYWPALPVAAREVQSPILIEEPPTPTPPPRQEPTPQPPEEKTAPPPTPEPRPGLPAAPPKPIALPELAPDTGMPKPVPLDGFGEMTGDPNASSLHSLSGDRPMQAIKGEQDQPLIRREPSMRTVDPDGLKADPNPTDTETQEPPQPTPAPQPKPDPTIAEQPKPQESRPAAPPDTPQPQPADPPRPTAAALSLPGPNSETDQSHRPTTDAPPQPPLLAMALPQPQPMSVERNPPLPTQQPPTGPTQRTSQPPSGQMAPQSDSDSDPFSTVGSAEFSAGRVVARFGRAVKTVRPQLTLAGRSDVLSLMGPCVVLEVHADETGAVRDVRITRSSGSNEIDQPCKLAMYKWWFEPPRDKSGRPKPSVMSWTISYSIR